MCFVTIYEVIVGQTKDYQTASVVFALFLSATPIFFLLEPLKREMFSKALIYFSLALDVFLLLLASYFHGGLEDTWLSVPVFVIFMASYIFGFRAGIIYAAYSFLLVLFSSVLQYAGVVPHFPQFILPEAHWRNPMYFSEYMAGLFIFYFISAAAVGLLTQLAEGRAMRIEEYRKKLEDAQNEVAKEGKAVGQIEQEIDVKLAELDRFERTSSDQQKRLIELKSEIERLRR